MAGFIKLLQADAISDGLKVQNAHFSSALEARDELEGFLRILLEKQPASVGGKLPDEGFYFSFSANRDEES